MNALLLGPKGGSRNTEGLFVDQCHRDDKSHVKVCSAPFLTVAARSFDGSYHVGTGNPLFDTHPLALPRRARLSGLSDMDTISLCTNSFNMMLVPVGL